MKLFLSILALLSINYSLSQNNTISIATIKTIHSDTLGEDRVLNIYTPDGYSPDSSYTYPVLYLLDGSANEDFLHIVGLVQFMTMCGEMEPTIVVGIANVDRKRDFTFPSLEKNLFDIPNAGGSAKFISFLKSELIPYVNANFKTTAKRTIIGQSLGGLVAAEILVKEPTLFTDYIIVSPSLWWDKESLIKLFEQTKLDFSKHHIYLAVGEEEPEFMVKDAKSLNKILAKSKPELYNLEILEDQDHANVLHQAAFNGLRILNTEPQPMRFPAH